MIVIVIVIVIEKDGRFSGILDIHTDKKNVKETTIAEKNEELASYSQKNLQTDGHQTKGTYI